MNPDKARRLDALTGQLAETLMSAAICADEIRAIVRTELDSEAPRPITQRGAGFAPNLPTRKQRPLLDESTMSVFWKGQSLHLGNTLPFRFLARLARRPNQYVTHRDLLRDVWDDQYLATATIRSVVRHLRERLRNGGMNDLAMAIRGHNGRYILDL
jgi:DNA-binding response OmpR family regulator